MENYMKITELLFPWETFLKQNMSLFFTKYTYRTFDQRKVFEQHPH